MRQEVVTERPFREGLMTLEPFALVGGRCRHCGTTSFPVRSTCSACRRTDEPKHVTLSDRGTVYSYTIVRQAPPGFDVPYPLAYVDLPEGVRLLSQLDHAAIGGIEIGMEVRLARRSMGVTEDGVSLVGYQFVADTQ